jgi:hypothetical protein
VGDSIILLVSWELWKECNPRTFQAESLSPPALFDRIVDEANAWIGTGFRAMPVFFGAARLVSQVQLQ